jgi:uncharacterized protein (DUF1015 family)
MAEIRPLRALHYNPERIGELGAVVTQPYDKISPAMQERYYWASPYNIVRIIRGREGPGDTPQNNVYTRAAQRFEDWRRSRILIADSGPALYPYYQEYAIPGQPGVKKERRGFIALCRLEDYAAGVVHRHEETLAGPKQDRVELLKATRAHFGQIFMLYSDPAGTVESLLQASTASRPWQQVTDEYGNRHSVWRASDPALMEAVATALRDKKLVIADGHHRYETALAYRDYCRGQGRKDTAAEYVMVTLIRMESEGLTILPTHRVVHSLPQFDWEHLTAEAQRFFDWEELKLPDSGEEQSVRLAESLARAGRERPTVAVYAGPGKLAQLSLRRDVDLVSLLPDVPASLRRLDVVLLHRLLLEKALRIDPQAVREERNLHYVRELPAALAQVASGRAQLCFLLNPTPIEAVRDNAFAGHVMPQKSTDFYPKLLSGLTIYALDQPEEK